MAQNLPQPWHPDRSWADPFIAALFLAILFLAGNQMRLRQAAQALPEHQVSLQGRLQDVLLGASHDSALAPLRAWSRPEAFAGLAARGNAWDQALLAVHAGESGALDTGAGLTRGAPGSTGAAFRQAWTRSYRGTGAAPAPADLRGVREALGDGYAARILEARLLAGTGGGAAPLRAQAQDWAFRRLLALGALGLAALLTGLGGLGFALYLLLVPARPDPWPHYGLSGRGVLIVMLGWFLTLMASGSFVATLVGLLPRLKPFYLPLAYACHALAGTSFLLLAEGVDLPTLWRRVAPGRHGRALATGLGFFALAFAAVVLVAMVVSPMLPGGESPQKALLELLARMRGPWTLLLLFLTVAVLAPTFEELMFRGFLLPWLGERLSASLGARRGRLLALLLTGLGFAVMHMQPLGLPTLATLGIVLGFAFLRTGNLLTAILVHGLWNGGVFILMRLLA